METQVQANLLVVLCIAMTAPTELIRNGSFEEGVDRPAAWKYAGKLADEITWESAGRTGRCISLGNSKPGHAYVYQSVASNPDTYHILTFYYKCQNTKGTARMRLELRGGKPGVRVYPLPAVTEWTQRTIVFDMGKATGVYVEPWLEKQIGQKVWFDDIAMRTFWVRSVSVIDKPTIDEVVLIDGSQPGQVRAENPSTPTLSTGQQGGLDEGQAGDDVAFYLASARDKRWKGGTVNPEAISVDFTTGADAEYVEIEIGYRAHKSQSRKFSIALDDLPLGSVNLPKGQYGNKEDALKVLRYTVRATPGVKRPKVHTLRIRQDDSWGITLIDAICIRAKSVKLVKPATAKQ